MREDNQPYRKERHKTDTVWSEMANLKTGYTSAEGAAYLSPALQRWVHRLKRAESRRDGRGGPACRTYGTPIHSYAYPALKRWAKIFRPAGGAGCFVMSVSRLTRSFSEKSGFWISFLNREVRR